MTALAELNSRETETEPAGVPRWGATGRVEIAWQ